jgi:rod shape-determining protein MreC
MRNLIQLLIRFHQYLLFIALEGIAFGLIATQGGYQQAKVFEITREISGGFYQQKDQLTNYLELQAVNDSLAAENARLRNQLQSAYIRVDTAFLLIADTTRRRRFRYSPALVVDNTSIRLNHYLSLAKGSAEGVEALMGVIAGEGVVGVVRGVSRHFSTVVTLQHTGFRLSAQIEPGEEVGSLQWGGEDNGKLQLRDIPRNAEVQKGWEVRTSPYSRIFPKGLLIGHIQDYSLPKGSNFYEIEVSMSAPLSKLERVYVVKNLMKAELDSLQQATVK